MIEVARRIDTFQIYSHFADLSRLVARSLSSEMAHVDDIATLDDTGYAARHVVARHPLTDAEIKDSLTHRQIWTTHSHPPKNY